MDHLFLIIASIFLVVAILWWICNRNVTRMHSSADLLAPKPLDTLLDKIDSTPDHPINFGYEMSWLAIQASNSQDVIASLSLDHLQPANWHTGFVAAYNGHAFITPPVDGWVFVVSRKLPELCYDPAANEGTSLLPSLSEKFGDVQFFSTHRVSESHAWARFKDGAEVRAFAYCDGPLVDRGDKTPGEVELGYNYFDTESPEAESDSYWEREDLCYPDEEHVMEIAGKWSINPITLESKDLPVGVGWIGNLRRELR